MWGRSRLFALVAGGAVLAIALGVGAALLIGRGGVDGPLDIPRIADPYPTPPRFTMPENCGVRSATLDEVMPHHELANRMENGCYFRTDRIRKNARHGSATITFTVGSPLNKGKVSVADAMSTFDSTTGRNDPGSDGTAWQNVIGLGDEAAVRYDDNYDHTEVVVRVQAVTAEITYVIRRAVGSESVPLDEKPSIDGALAIAGDVARALGGKVESPAVGSKPGSSPALTAPDACDLITPATLQRLDRKATPSKGDSSGILSALSEADEDRCYWQEGAGSRTDQTSLSVVVKTFTDGAQGSGEEKAARYFLKTYHEAREGGIDSYPVARRNFHPLSAPGEQAMAYYSVGSPLPQLPKMAEGVVVFRIRNLVVEVSYDGVSGGEPLSEAVVLNRAYLGAKDAAAALAG
jgi:hypothetical protein